MELRVRKLDWEHGGLLVAYFRDRLAENLENLKYYRAEVEKAKLDIIFLTSSKETTSEDSSSVVLAQKPARRITIPEPEALPDDDDSTAVRKKGPDRVVTSKPSMTRQMVRIFSSPPC